MVFRQPGVMGLHTPWPDTPGTQLVTDEDMRRDSFWPTQIVFAFHRNCISVQWLISSQLIPAIQDGWKDTQCRSVSSAREKPSQWHAYSKNLSTHKMIHPNNTEVKALKSTFKKRKRKNCNLLKYLTHMCWRVNIAIWMDPLAKEYQTNSETITNILYKAPHGYTVHS